MAFKQEIKIDLWFGNLIKIQMKTIIYRTTKTYYRTLESRLYIIIKFQNFLIFIMRSSTQKFSSKLTK